jgi:hypothetical protein
MISCGWIISHRCSLITVYVLCCNAQVNLIVILMTCTCIVMHSLFCQLPNYNLFTQHVIYLYGEIPLVNCGPRSILLHLYYHLLQSTFYFPQALLYFTANKHLFPHYTSNSLFSANRWDWQPHCKLRQSSLVVLCAGSMLLLAPRLSRQPRTNLFSRALPKSASNNLQKWFLSPTGRLNLGFILRENLLLCSSYHPLGISQLVLWDIKTVFWRRCRGERGFLQGECLISNLFTLLLFCLVSLLYFVYFLFIKNIKK